MQKEDISEFKLFKSAVIISELSAFFSNSKLNISGLLVSIKEGYKEIYLTQEEIAYLKTKVSSQLKQLVSAFP